MPKAVAPDTLSQGLKSKGGRSLKRRIICDCENGMCSIGTKSKQHSSLKASVIKVKKISLPFELSDQTQRNLMPIVKFKDYHTDDCSVDRVSSKTKNISINCSLEDLKKKELDSSGYSKGTKIYRPEWLKTADSDCSEWWKNSEADHPGCSKSTDVDVSVSLRSPKIEYLGSSRSPETDLPECSRSIDIGSTKWPRTDSNHSRCSKSPEADLLECSRSTEADLPPRSRSIDIDSPESTETFHSKYSRSPETDLLRCSKSIKTELPAYSNSIDSPGWSRSREGDHPGCSTSTETYLPACLRNIDINSSVCSKGTETGLLECSRSPEKDHQRCSTSSLAYISACSKSTETGHPRSLEADLSGCLKNTEMVLKNGWLRSTEADRHECLKSTETETLRTMKNEKNTLFKNLSELLKVFNKFIDSGHKCELSFREYVNVQYARIQKELINKEIAKKTIPILSNAPSQLTTNSNANECSTSALFSKVASEVAKMLLDQSAKGGAESLTPVALSSSVPIQSAVIIPHTEAHNNSGKTGIQENFHTINESTSSLKNQSYNPQSGSLNKFRETDILNSSAVCVSSLPPVNSFTSRSHYLLPGPLTNNSQTDILSSNAASSLTQSTAIAPSEVFTNSGQPVILNNNNTASNLRKSLERTSSATSYYPLSGTYTNRNQAMFLNSYPVYSSSLLPVSSFTVESRCPMSGASSDDSKTDILNSSISNQSTYTNRNQAMFLNSYPAYSSSLLPVNSFTVESRYPMSGALSDDSKTDILNSSISNQSTVSSITKGICNPQLATCNNNNITYLLNSSAVNTSSQPAVIIPQSGAAHTINNQAYIPETNTVSASGQSLKSPFPVGSWPQSGIHTNSSQTTILNTNVASTLGQSASMHPLFQAQTDNNRNCTINPTVASGLRQSALNAIINTSNSKQSSTDSDKTYNLNPKNANTTKMFFVSFVQNESLNPQSNNHANKCNTNIPNSSITSIQSPVSFPTIGSNWQLKPRIDSSVTSILDTSTASTSSQSTRNTITKPLYNLLPRTSNIETCIPNTIAANISSQSARDTIMNRLYNPPTGARNSTTCILNTNAAGTSSQSDSNTITNALYNPLAGACNNTTCIPNTNAAGTSSQSDSNTITNALYNQLTGACNNTTCIPNTNAAGTSSQSDSCTITNALYNPLTEAHNSIGNILNTVYSSKQTINDFVNPSDLRKLLRTHTCNNKSRCRKHEIVSRSSQPTINTLRNRSNNLQSISHHETREICSLNSEMASSSSQSVVNTVRDRSYNMQSRAHNDASKPYIRKAAISGYLRHLSANNIRRRNKLPSKAHNSKTDNGNITAAGTSSHSAASSLTFRKILKRRFSKHNNNYSSASVVNKLSCSNGHNHSVVDRSTSGVFEAPEAASTTLERSYSLFDALGNLRSVTLSEAFSGLLNGGMVWEPTFREDVDVEVARMLQHQFNQEVDDNPIATFHNATTSSFYEDVDAEVARMLQYQYEKEAVKTRILSSNAASTRQTTVISPLPRSHINNHRTDRDILKRVLATALFHNIGRAGPTQQENSSQNTNSSGNDKQQLNVLVKPPLPSTSISGAEDECSICMNEFNEGGLVESDLCRHKFHEACINDWLRIGTTCPMCRAKWDSKKNVYIL